MKSFVADSVLKNVLLLFPRFWVDLGPSPIQCAREMFISPEKGKMLRKKGKARECFAPGGYKNGARQKLKGELI